MMTETTATTAQETATSTTPKLAKSATITLTANGSMMQIVAERKADDTARTYVITTDAAKKSERGMTETHATFEAAKTANEKTAKAAVKLGWTRKEARRGFVVKPDAFTALPAPAPAPVAKAKK